MTWMAGGSLRAWSALLAVVVCTCLATACTTVDSGTGGTGQSAELSADYATHLAAFSATWIDRPLDGTIIVDPLKPIPIIGHATGIAVGSATLRIKQAGAELPAVTLTQFTPEREGLMRIDGVWQIPPFTPNTLSGDVIYELWLVVNGSQESKIVKLHLILATPTSISTSTGTATSTATPSPTSTDTRTPTPTRTPTGTPTMTATLTDTPTPTSTSSPTLTSTTTPTATLIPTPTATATLTATQSATPTSTPSPTATLTDTLTSIPSPSMTSTPTQGSCVAYVSGEGDQQIANVRKGPGTLYPIIGQITVRDGRYNVTGQVVYADGSTWWEIQFTPDQKGFVSKDFVTLEGSCDQLPDATPPPLPCLIKQYTIDSAVITLGQSTTIHWAVQGASAVTINGQSVKSSGQMQVSTAGTYTLNVRCAEGGTKTASVSLTVNVPPPPPPGGGGGPVCTPRGGACGRGQPPCCPGLRCLAAAPVCG